MDLPRTKRRKVLTANSLQAKAQNLPLLCVEAICKFTPTAKLIRLYSSAVPLPGACWSYGLEAVLKKRLPLSLSDDSPCHQAPVPRTFALFDTCCAKVATIFRPKMFRFSPLCEFVESGTFTVRAVDGASRAMGIGFQLYVVRGEALLSQLSKLTDLSFVLRDDSTPLYEKLAAEGDVLDCRNLAHLLPQLTSFEISSAPFLERDVIDFMRAMPLHEMSSLRRLILPEKALSGVMQSAMSNSPQRRGTRLTLSGLSSLAAWQNCQGGAWYSDCVSVRPEMLHFVSVCCRNVSSLSLLVDGDFRAYLAVFRALTGLSTLGLHLLVVTGLTFNRNETFTSVVDLRFTCATINARDDVLAIASRFPNAQAVAFQYSHSNRDAFDLALRVCERQVLPNVLKLSCFLSNGFFAVSCWRLEDFLASPDLPAVVDLSQVIFEQLARDPLLLAGIYGAMTGNSTRTLLLRGPLHRESLQGLQTQICLDLPGGTCSITSRWDRDLGRQPALGSFTDISQLADVKIVCMKTSGSLNGEEFTIRIVHRLAKRSRIFD